MKSAIIPACYKGDISGKVAIIRPYRLYYLRNATA